MPTTQRIRRTTAARPKEVAAPEGEATERTRAQRMNPQDRENIILERAIEHFALEGFSASTRELAQSIGVTHSLLYKYFPSKDALLDKVYERVYLARLELVPEQLLLDRTVPIQNRLKQYYVTYAQAMLQNDWVRIFLFAGLRGASIHERLLTLIRERIFLPVVRELRAELGMTTPKSKAEAELQIELVWGLHASIFYLGIRKWVYEMPVPRDIDVLIESLVEVFFYGFKARYCNESNPK